MQAYSRDLRLRVISAMQKNANAREVAKLFKVSKSYVSHCWLRWSRDGEDSARARGASWASVLREHMPVIKAYAKRNDVTLKDIIQFCKDELGIEIKQTALWYQMNKAGLSFKKNSTRQRARQGRRKIET